MPEEQSTERHPDLVPALRGWHLAKEQARRYNRNLLQYAAGVVALLGIGSGTGAVIAVAQGLEGNQDTDDVSSLVILIIAAVVAAIALPFIVFLARAFWLRGEAERDVADHLSELIALDPDRFWPSEE
jgi:hypothetical protein